MKKIIIYCLVVFFIQPSKAQINVAKLDSFFNQIDEHHRAMLSVCIAENGRPVYQKSIGFAEIQKDTKIRENTVFRIGSISKMFTAVMIMQLVDEKKISLNQPLSDFFPEFTNANKISIAHLLQHRSGLVNLTADTNYTNYQKQFQTQEVMIQRLVSLGTEFEPNAQGKYSNTNFILLGYIIERLTKAKYADELKRRICKKAGLKNTYYGQNIQTSKSEALSYEWDGGIWNVSVETDMSIPGGAGSIASTPTDLCLFIQALFDGKLMSPTSLATMKTMQDGFGLGLLQMPFGKRKAYGHNGSIDAFRSSLGYFEDDKMSFSIISNGRSIPQNDIALGLLSIYYNKHFIIPSYKINKLSDDVLNQYIGIYNNTEVGLRMNMTKKNGQLMAQVDGQNGIVLDSIAEDEFKFDPAEIRIKFKRDNNKNLVNLVLKQGDEEIEFIKEK